MKSSVPRAPVQVWCVFEGQSPDSLRLPLHLVGTHKGGVQRVCTTVWRSCPVEGVSPEGGGHLVQ